MELNRENYEEMRSRDYRAEVEMLEKRLCLFEEENTSLKLQVESLKECIVRMSIARYLRNDV